MNARSGLSLFELLVALALLALIAAGLASALGLAVNVWERTAADSSSSEEIALRSRLRILLRNATSPSRVTPFQAQFMGDQDGFSFVTLAQTPFAPAAAALRVQIVASGDRLIFNTHVLSDTGEEINKIETQLATNIDTRFSYYSADSDSPGWQDIWENTGQLPVLVRIEAPEGSNPEWPTFVVRLQMK